MSREIQAKEATHLRLGRWVEIGLCQLLFLHDSLLGLLHVRRDAVGLDERVRFLLVVFTSLLDERVLEFLLIEDNWVLDRRHTNFNWSKQSKSVLAYCKLEPCSTE